MEKEKNDLISVIVPVYNGENYIKMCIDSLLNQDYENLEIIIVNDGSTDNTSLLIHSSFNDNEKITIIDKNNSGVSDSRNVGIAAASGKYITFIDADDTVEPSFISYLYGLITENGGQISLTRFPNKVKEGYNSANEINKCDYVESISGIQAAKEMLYYKIVISSWNKMYETAFLKAKDILFNKKLSYGEGFDFVINCFLHSEKVSIGSFKFYNYRVDNVNSVMTNFKPELAYGSINAQVEIENRIKSFYDPELAEAQRYAYWHTCCDCFNTIVGCKAKKKNSDLYTQLRRDCRRNAKYAFNSNVPVKDKIKAVLFFINPYLAAVLINRLRSREFTRINN